MRTESRQEFSTELVAVKALAQRFGVRPSKQHSQNFLLDRTVVERMVQSSKVHAGDVVLEVGGGFGVLTKELLSTGADVQVYEIDERLAAALSAQFLGQNNFHLLATDFFRWFVDHAKDLSSAPFSIIANLPYQSSSHFFKTVLSGEARPQQIIVLLQKEVAERIAAKPGDMSLLALSVQLFGTPSVLLNVPRTSFWPAPDVDSAVLAVTDIHNGQPEDTEVFRIARMGFANKRKMLSNSLAAGLHVSTAAVRDLLEPLGIAPEQRPQDLTVQQWRDLARTTLTQKSR